MTGLTATRLLSIMFAAESLAMLAAGDPAAASTLRVSTGSAQRAANEVEADYTTSHVLISEKARESVSITIFFDLDEGHKKIQHAVTQLLDVGMLIG